MINCILLKIISSNDMGGGRMVAKKAVALPVKENVTAGAPGERKNHMNLIRLIVYCV
jgi:hypothetical protein